MTSTETKTESPLEILQKRLALGEITKEEFNELKSVFENKEEQSDNETEQNSDEQDDEPQPVNSGRWV
ncbi:SHOCT domain-containing protein [Marine Group I thaumarchaeote]|uniref:SHOCT domain-containing protein n=1 Tax=Marine Group I thaumarchaeote TaxID=2511932 RepID=A0A7K4N7L0_9ARCH|nr:SHOCT domain-containing protein [Marine Group I thaumarchaeote]